MQEITLITRYFAGPLNLDRETGRADTAFGAELILNENEFDALDMLAIREGQPVTFQQLYEAVWEKPDGSGSMAAAKEALEMLIIKVAEAGGRFM